jgi:hypothetical protein
LALFALALFQTALAGFEIAFDGNRLGRAVAVEHGVGVLLMVAGATLALLSLLTVDGKRGWSLLASTGLLYAGGIALLATTWVGH